jgi:hypothetical protein
VEDTDLAEVVTRLVGCGVESTRRVHGGRNAQVLEVTCDDGSRYAAKRYFRHEADPRDRLGVEFESSRFLWANGIRVVPEPIAADAEAGVGVYAFIDGEPIAPAEVGEADVDAAVRFAIALRTLASAPGADSLPRASASCFSLRDVACDVEGRMSRFAASGGAGGERVPDDVLAFVRERLSTAYGAILDWCGLGAEALGWSMTEEIPHAERTLSPSDFGFHNALRTPGGHVVFLDLEYFGWDDPAKMISDVLLHPGTRLSTSLGRRFFEGVVGGLADLPGLARRVELMYPLVGVLWCLILLNEYLPEHSARRSFAGAGPGASGAPGPEQLRRAEAMLDRITDEYQRFPYDG